MKRQLLIWTGLLVMTALFLPAVLWANTAVGTQKALDQAFFFALNAGHVSQFAAIRDRGAGLNTTLQIAGLQAQDTFPDQVDVLLTTDADIQNWPILTWAVFLQNEDMVRILIKSGAALNSADRKGSTPLHWAAWTGNYPIAKTLLENGANPFMQDDLGRSPLDWALLTGQADIIRMLPRVAMPEPLDSDGDGVPDYRDACPLTPKGVFPDERGCWVIAHNEYFDFDKATVKKRYIPDIKKAAKIMDKNAHLQLELVGHTDDVGTQAYNNKLGLARATAVMKILINSGVHPDRLRVMTYGENKPVAPNDTPYGRAKNRRVEVNVFEPTPSDRVVSKSWEIPVGMPAQVMPVIPQGDELVTYETDDGEIVAPEPMTGAFTPMPMMIPGPQVSAPQQVVPVLPPQQTTSYEPVVVEQAAMTD